MISAAPLATPSRAGTPAVPAGPASAIRSARDDRRAVSSQPMPADGRDSLVHWKNVTMITANMMAAPPIHITAPPSCRSLTADGPHERGSSGTNGSVW